MKELSFEEMEMITGGSWLSDAWNWVQQAATDVAQYIVSLFVTGYENTIARYLDIVYDAWKSR
ncbi:MAG: hypothetical protein WCI31_06120 [Prolixibacteraceae bacterium]|jgi:hypothetical protein